MRKWLRITVFVGLGVLLLVAVGLLLIWKALQHVPEFYREALAVTPAIEEEAGDENSPQPTAPASDGEQEDGLNALFARATALASDRDAPAGTPAIEEETGDENSPQATAPASDREQEQEGRWNALFTAKEVNGWLAVDLGKNLANLVHGSLSDPRVAIDEDTLMVGCRLRRGDVITVLSLSGDAFLTGPNTVAVRIRRAQAGALPLPVGRIERYISEAANRSGLTVQWRQVDRLPVALISFPPPRTEADRLVQIDTLRFGKGEIYLSGSTQQP